MNRISRRDYIKLSAAGAFALLLGAGEPVITDRQAKWDIYFCG